MGDTDFVLNTTCPAGHSIPFRRTLSIWRLSLDAPTVVLWCYECGLQWDASQHDRAAVTEAVTCATSIEPQPPGDNVVDRDLKADANALTGPRKAHRTDFADAIDAVKQSVEETVPFATRLIRHCGVDGEPWRLRAPLRSRQHRCGAIRMSKAWRTTPAFDATLSDFHSEQHADESLAHGVFSRLRWDPLWWPATAVGVAIVASIALLWSPRPGFIADGAIGQVATREQPAEASSVTVTPIVDQPTVQAPTALARPVGNAANLRRAVVSSPARRNRTSASSERPVRITARIPAGTLVPLSLETAVDSTRTGTPVRARVSQNVVVDQQVVIPRGSILQGHVTGAERKKSRWISALKVWEFGKQRNVVLGFTSMRTPGSTGKTYRIRTAPVPGQAKSASHRVAIPAAIATVGGAVLAGPLGAAGAGMAARAVAGSIDDDARLPSGTAMEAQILEVVLKQ